MKAIFLAEPHKDYPNPLHYNYEVVFNLRVSIDDLVTTNLSFLCFDLITHWGFKEIYLYSGGKMHELKLGKNDWTEKELRESHNLLKLVKSNILNK
jgi:hypothetical protein